jgi:hypothetical protein
VTPTITIPLELLTSRRGRVILDDGWDDRKTERDITREFEPVGYDAVARDVPFRFGTNRLTYELSGGATFEVYSMHYDAETPAIVEEHAHLDGERWFDEIDESGNRNRVVRNGLNLVIGEDPDEGAISSYLRVYRMRPVGYASIIGLYNVYVHGRDQSADRDKDGISDLRNYVLSSGARFDPRAGLLHEDFQMEYDAVAERVQPSIARVAATDYTVANRGWALPAPPPPAPGAPNALGWAGEHFWMATFPAHRLRSAWFSGLAAADRVVNFPVIGVADSGFGKEGTFPNADMPVTNDSSNFWDLWSNVGTGAGGQPVLINNENRDQVGFTHRPVRASDFRDDKIWDRITAGGHGTGVAHFVNAQGGQQKMGTGTSTYVSVIKLVGLDDVGGIDRINVFSFAAYAAAASIAERVPEVRAVNFSNGMPIRTTAAAPNAQLIAERLQESELLFDRLARAGIAACVSSRNSSLFVFPLPAPLPAGGLLVPVPGLVAPVRGTRGATTDTYELRNGATVGAADNFSPLMLRVGGLVLPNTGGGVETVWGPGVAPAFQGSGVGGNVSVAGHANQIHSVTPTAGVDFNIGGTSFSTPSVCGVLGEVIRILDIRAKRLSPTTAAQRADAARVRDVRRAIEIVEATADRVLGRNPAANFDAAESAPNNQMGFGRLNLWKATLTAINGGLADGGTDQGAAPLGFGTLVPAPGLVNAANTSFYGFDLRLRGDTAAVTNRFDAATAWLNDNPHDDRADRRETFPRRLTDTGSNTDFTGSNGGAGVRNVIAFKRTLSVNSRLPVGFTAAAAAAGGITEMAFSSSRQELTPPAGVNRKRLELRGNADDQTRQPFFSLPLNITALRNNAAVGGDPANPTGNGTNVRFDDFVFEILVDHFVTFRINGVDDAAEVRQIAAGNAALAAANEVELIVNLNDAAGAGVNGTDVDFIVANATTGAEDPDTQIRLRAARGAGATAATLRVATASVMAEGAGAARDGIARVFVTRIAKAGRADGVETRILVRVNTNSAAVATAGREFPQEFTVPVRRP